MGDDGRGDARILIQDLLLELEKLRAWLDTEFVA